MALAKRSHDGEPFEVEVYDSIAEWKNARAHAIGSSDAGALWGESSFNSPRSLYEAKANGVEADIDPRWALMGHLMEPVIAELYRHESGRSLVDPGAATIYRSKQWPWMAASLDRQILAADIRGDGALECKSRGAWAMREWDEAPPLDTVLQVEHVLAVTGWRWGVIGVLFGNQPRFIEIERDDELIELHVEKCRQFWLDHVEKRIAPPVDGHRATTEVLRRLYRGQEGKVVQFGEQELEAHRRLEELKGTIKRSEAAKKLIENQLLESFGDAEAAMLPDGQGAYRITRVGECQVPAFTRASHIRLTWRKK